MSNINKIMEAYLSMKVSEQEQIAEACGTDKKKKEVEEKKLDPVNDAENDKKFKDRKDKDIDNDGDVDSSDEYLHKKRKATDDAIDGGKKPAVKEENDSVDLEEGKMKEFHYHVGRGKSAQWIAKKMDLDMKTVKALMDDIKESTDREEEGDEEESEKKPFPPKKKKKDDEESEAEPEADGDSDIKKNPKTADKKAEISKIESVDTRSAFEKMWTEIVEAKNDPKKIAADGEKYDDHSSEHDKKVIDMHKKSDKKIEDQEEEGHDVTFKAGGKDMKQAPARSGADNLKNGDKTPPKK